MCEDVLPIAVQILLAAWLLANLDRTIFWAAAQKDATFTVAQVARGLHATSVSFEEEYDWPESLRRILKQTRAFRDFCVFRPKQLGALNKSWRKVDPYRSLKAYPHCPGQVIPTQLMHASQPASDEISQSEEHIVRIEPGYQDFSKVRKSLTYGDA